MTNDVHAALKHLSAQAVPGGTGVYWPFRNFWKQMEGPQEGESYRQEGRWQQANAAMRGMRLRVPD